MNCNEAESFVSVLYDGESVPLDAASHIQGCESCRDRLRSYSEMGAELRLMASGATSLAALTPPCKALSHHRSPRLAFLSARVLVPRFAVALLLAALIATSTTIVVLRAQSEKPTLWFQFGVDLKGRGPAWMNQSGKTGSDQGFVLWIDQQVIGVHCHVTSIDERRVQLEIRALKLEPDAVRKGLFYAERDIRDLQDHPFTYIVGESLEIPVEGGGALVLHGQVVDHQPKLIWGLPAEPGSDQIVLTSPLVLSGQTLLANVQGGSSFASDRNSGGMIYVPGVGRIVIALQPMPGAVQGEANWGDLNFTWQGKGYTIRTVSPITGGAQPRTIWVTVDSEHPWSGGSSFAIGTWPLTASSPQ